MNRHFVTGATGFVGGAVVLELLRRTQDAIVVLVRPGDTSAEERFFKTITAAAEAYAETATLRELGRCRVVKGDVVENQCGVQPQDLGHITHVWHSAASLRYENRYKDEIEAINVAGTRNVLALAQRLEAAHFNYISTAYVAGRRNGVIAESPAKDDAVNNHYEQSKVAAEFLVAAAPMAVRILRPSIVIGHSRTRAATTFSGFYGFIRQMAQFRGIAERAQEGLLARTPLRLRVNTDAAINLVPIDAVAEEAVSIGLSDAQGIFHLSHPSPPNTAQTIRTIFDVLGLHEPLFVSTQDQLSWLDQQLDKRLDFYGSYILGNKTFERKATDAALTRAGRAPFAYEEIAVSTMARWYLPILEQTRSALPVSR